VILTPQAVASRGQAACSPNAAASVSGDVMLPSAQSFREPNSFSQRALNVSIAVCAFSSSAGFA
jgi:hypothetical protein